MSKHNVSFIACLGADNDNGQLFPSVLAWSGEVPYNPPDANGHRSIAICDAFAVCGTFEAAMNMALNMFEGQYRAEMRKQYEKYQEMEQAAHFPNSVGFALLAK